MSFQQVSVQELARMRAEGAPVWLLDVRQPWERDLAVLADSHFIPLGELPARLAEVDPPDGALVVVYCHHGIRSLSGAALLAQHGHANVASLAGGIDSWSLLVDPAVPRY
jgi:adenylyltransferase/sulfurtransferase